MTEPIRLVIIEDHALVAEALADTLGRQPDIEVVGIADGLGTAEDLLDRVAVPDVALLDVHLPDGDGASGAARIRQRSPDTAVVILTASAGLDVLARAIRAGAAGLLSKGEPVQVVTDAIRRVHAGGVLFDAATLVQVAGHLEQPQVRPGGDLTPRESEVLTRLADGASTRAIADEFVLSLHTVRNHVRNILTKLGAHSKLEAVAIATRQGLIELTRDTDPRGS